MECIYLLCRRRDVVLGAVMAIVSLAANAGLLSTVRHQHHVMKQLVNRRSIVPVVHFGWVRALASWRLVPGDVVVLQRGRVSCDMVLLRGSCLVEESMLSGEVSHTEWASYTPWTLLMSNQPWTHASISTPRSGVVRLLCDEDTSYLCTHRPIGALQTTWHLWGLQMVCPRVDCKALHSLQLTFVCYPTEDLLCKGRGPT